MPVCPMCDRDEPNLDGAYAVHYDKAGVLRCPNSGEPVEAPEPAKKAPRKKSPPKK